MEEGWSAYLILNLVYNRHDMDPQSKRYAEETGSRYVIAKRYVNRHDLVIS